MKSNILPISLLMALLVSVYFFSPPLVLKACGIQFAQPPKAQNEFLNGPSAYPPPGNVLKDIYFFGGHCTPSSSFGNCVGSTG